MYYIFRYSSRLFFQRTLIQVVFSAKVFPEDSLGGSGWSLGSWHQFHYMLPGSWFTLCMGTSALLRTVSEACITQALACTMSFSLCHKMKYYVAKQSGLWQLVFFVAVQKQMGTKIEVSLLVLFYSHSKHIPPPNDLTIFLDFFLRKNL